MSLKKYLLWSVTLCTMLMSFIDGVIVPPYWLKSMFKIILFLIVPSVCILVNKEHKRHFKKLFIPQKKDFLLSLGLGIAIFAIILLGFWLLGDYIDFEGIVNNLTSGIGVNANNFIYVALYISFCNSLLEEFFFRGYAFLLMKEVSSRKNAYIFSAAMFAIYHAGMMTGWFNVFIYAIAMIGLFVAGCLFNWLNDKCNNIYPSWLVHMFANFGINLVGAIIFGIV